jgi:hypothetical protein
MAEADFSNKNLGPGGAIIIGVWLTHRDKGGLSSLDLASCQAATILVVISTGVAFMPLKKVSMAPFSQADNL